MLLIMHEALGEHGMLPGSAFALLHVTRKKILYL